MHLRNGPLNDCDKAWSLTVPTLDGTNLTNYKNYLNSTGCPLTVAQRNPDQPHWGTNSQKINMALLNTTVAAGQVIGWAGSTGPGGCGCTDGTTNENTHLHIFYAHRDPTDSKWYFFDPYGIYSDPTCYPAGVNQAITTSCARYPISWKNGKPDYPAAPQFFADANNEAIFSTNVATGISITPNPSVGNITVTYNSEQAGKLNLTVYNKTGIAVFNRNENAIAGSNTYQLNLPSLISGVYYLEVNNNGIKTRDKFIISK